MYLVCTKEEHGGWGGCTVVGFGPSTGNLATILLQRCAPGAYAVEDGTGASPRGETQVQQSEEMVLGWVQSGTGYSGRWE